MSQEIISNPVIRLFLRAVIFLVVTVFLASLLSTLLFAVVVFGFDVSGDSFFDARWPLLHGGCLLLAAVVVWRFLPIRTANFKE